MEEDPALFQKSDWKQSDRFDLRTAIVDHWRKIVKEMPWNEGVSEDIGTAPVLPMVHGTGSAVAWKIVKNGFSVLSTLDAGYYGSGMYFTSNVLYAVPYFATKANPTVLVCLGVSGNPYPVVERRDEEKSLLGQPLRSGYQSHYVLTKIDGNPISEPPEEHDEFFDEIVLAQETQVVPVYLVEVSASHLTGFVKKYQRDVLESDTSRPDVRRENTLKGEKGSDDLASEV